MSRLIPDGVAKLLRTPILGVLGRMGEEIADKARTPQVWESRYLPIRVTSSNVISGAEQTRTPTSASIIRPPLPFTPPRAKNSGRHPSYRTTDAKGLPNTSGRRPNPLGRGPSGDTPNSRLVGSPSS